MKKAKSAILQGRNNPLGRKTSITGTLTASKSQFEAARTVSASKGMKIVKASDAKQKFGRLIDMAQRGPVTVTSHDRPVAVVVSIEDYDNNQDRKWKMLMARLEKAKLDIAEGKMMSTNELIEKIKSSAKQR